MKFIDLFSGIGGFRSALELCDHECMAFAEIDKYARQSYKAIYDTEHEEEWHDVTKITDEQFKKYHGIVDIVVGGFPCQAFSIAGHRKGFEDTRGTLFFEIARAIQLIQPKYALLENVKGLFSHEKGSTFATIIRTLDEMGYVVEWGLFNSKYWGVPQNRERVFILATRKDIFTQPVIFNLLKQQTTVSSRLMDILEDEVDEKYYLRSEKSQQLIDMMRDKIGKNERVVVDASINEPRIKEVMNTVIARYDSGIQNQRSTGGAVIEPAIRQIGNVVDNKETFGGNPQRGRVYDAEGISPTLNCMQGGGLEPKIVVDTLPKGEIINPLKNKTDYGWHFEQGVFDEKGIARTVKANGGSGNIPKVITEEKTITNVIGSTQKNATVNDGNLAPTLTSSMGTGGGHVPMTLYTDLRIRKLTPLECWRLQGFKDEQFYKAQEDGLSNAQLYKQAGNSVTVNVVHAIVSKLK